MVPYTGVLPQGFNRVFKDAAMLEQSRRRKC